MLAGQHALCGIWHPLLLGSQRDHGNTVGEGEHSQRVEDSERYENSRREGAQCGEWEQSRRVGDSKKGSTERRGAQWKRNTVRMRVQQEGVSTAGGWEHSKEGEHRGRVGAQ